MLSRPPARPSWRNRRGLEAVLVVVALALSSGLYLVCRAATTTPCDKVRFRTSQAAPAVHRRPPLGSGGLTHLLRQAFHGSSAAVFCDDFPDPFVLRVGGSYYLYSTNTAGSHIPVLHAGGFTGGGARHDALPQLPAWSAGDEVWAPSVLHRGPAFVMYYATRLAGEQRPCISAPVSCAPRGPL